MKYQDLMEEDLGQLKKYSPDEMTVVWVDDFFDGPLGGLCEIDGRSSRS